jgi:hypothetical protein
VNDLDPSVVIAGVALVGTLAGVAGTVLGALITRSTETRRIIAGAPTGYQQLVDDLQQERDRQDRKIGALADEVASMRTRMRGLEAGQDTDRRLIEVLRSHINELRSALRRAGIAPPPAPAGSGVEDSGEHLAVSPA